MKRDMDLVRSILLAVEANPSPVDMLAKLDISDADPVAIHHHVALLAQAGLLDARERKAMGLYEWYPIALTWKGHEFLDTVRNPEVWRETKGGLAKIGGASVEVVIEIAKGFAKHLVKEKLGIDLL